MKSVPSKPLWQLSATEIAHRIRTGSTSSEDVINAHLQRLADVNPALNAVVVERAEAALREAQEADRLQASGATLGPLHGVPVAVKVNTDLASAPNTNGVEALKDVVAPADNPCLKNLKDAGAIVIGQTNTPAYSMRWHTDNELHGQTLNPWSAAHTSGGSSGGASSAVAAGIAPIAHGNDIAGSIRYPAFCCGLVGVRPSHGRVPSFNPSAPGARPISAQFMAVPKIRDMEAVCVDVVPRTHDSATLYFFVGETGAYSAGQFITIDPKGTLLKEGSQETAFLQDFTLTYLLPSPKQLERREIDF